MLRIALCIFSTLHLNENCTVGDVDDSEKIFVIQSCL